ncbi:MAG TPA: serine/threonine-protein kinase, partial [Kofleriaceae bacterium]
MTELGYLSTLGSGTDSVDTNDASYLALPDLRPGTVVGRYVLTAKLGAGGMGVVHAAYDPQLDRRLAVKLVRDESATSQDARHERLLREARAMAQVDHANVIRVFDAGTTEVRGRERVFVAMELVDGAPLGTWARGKPWRTVLEACVAAGHGLAAAHAAGLVHRDFKPDNVLVDRTGRARVGDFGLVGSTGEVSPDNALTQAGAVMGTPGFMAPEQKRGEPVDARADQYSFCRTVSTLVTAPPRWLAPILAHGLDEDPARRYPALADVLAAIERKLRRRRWVVSAAALVAVAAGTALIARPPPPRATCSTLAGVWDPTTRGALQPVIAAALDRYAWDWTLIENARCHANERGAAADRAEACVELRRAQLGAIVRELRRVPADAQPDALGAVEALPSPRDCADPARLALQDPMPATLLLRNQVALARAQLTAVHGLANIGRFDDAERLLAAIRVPPFPPLAAEVAYARADLVADRDRDDNLQPALAAYGTAIRLAAESSYDYLMIAALLDRAFDLTDHTEALRWFELAEGFTARLGNPPELVAHLHGNRADVRRRAGDLPGAVADARRAFEVRSDHEGLASA